MTSEYLFLVGLKDGMKSGLILASNSRLRRSIRGEQNFFVGILTFFCKCLVGKESGLSKVPGDTSLKIELTSAFLAVRSCRVNN